MPAPKYFASKQKVSKKNEKLRLLCGEREQKQEKNSNKSIKLTPQVNEGKLMKCQIEQSEQIKIIIKWQ